MAELFTAVGTLRLLIVQACDIFSPHFVPKQLSKLSPKKGTNGTSTSKLSTTKSSSPNDSNDTVCAAFATVSICNDLGVEVHRYDTAVQPCYDLPSDGVLDMGEEFVFDGIPSTSVVIISVYSVLSSPSNFAGSAVKEKENDSVGWNKSSYNLFSSKLRGTPIGAMSGICYSPNKTEKRVICVGFASIPVSRLEENKSVRVTYNVH